MSLNLEFGSHAGPKTVICVFAYGGVHPNMVNALIESTSKAAYITGRSDRCNETLSAQSMPEMATHWPVVFWVAPSDALVSRSRSVMAQRFLEGTDAEVLIMLDHDHWWVPPTKDYEGDLLHIARQCADVKGIVAAAVSKKVRGQGIASMMKRDGEFVFGSEPILEPAWYVGSAFCAYHRDVLSAISNDGYLYGSHVNDTKVCQVVPGFKPIFMEMVVRHPNDPNSMLHLSEDWALCHRARELGYESYISCKPLVIHYGEYPFQVVRDAAVTDQAVVSEQHDQCMPKGATISCLHATRGRPEKASEAIARWVAAASDKSKIEYIVSVDEDDETMEGWQPPDVGIPVTVVIGGSRGNVDAYNRAYLKSSGQVLVQVHDDVYPPEAWDSAVCKAVDDATKPVALHVGDGLSESVNNGKDLMAIAVVSRPFAQRLGGMFFPEYISVCCDDDLTEFAKVHGYARDAKYLTFKHAWEGSNRDETQIRSYRAYNWEWGQNVLQRRRAAGFPEVANA